MFKKIWDSLQNPWVATACNLTMVSIAYLGNAMIQVYCQPVTWAAIVLVISFVPVVFWPLLRGRWQLMHPVLQMVRGVAFCICIYCIIFLENINLALPFLIPFGVGIMGLVPHFFVVQLLVQTFARKVAWVQRGTFLVGIGFCLMLAGYFIWDFRAAVPIARGLAAHPEEYDGPHAGCVEWIIGMHFKYHTRVEAYDGWRPPLHDPAAVIGFWSIGLRDPLSLKFPARIALYRQVFPDHPAQASCACARSRDGLRYFSDPVFSTGE